MKKFKHIFKVAAAAVVLCILVNVTNPQPETWLEKKLDRPGLSVVYFYNDKDPQAQTDVFRQAHQSKIFQQAGIYFLRVNAQKPENASLVEEFDLTQFPTIMLFEDGDAVMQGSDMVKLTEFTTAQDIKRFIKSNFGSAIQEQAAVREPRTKVYRIVRRERTRPNVGVSFGLGYPYYDYWYGNPYGYYDYYRPYWGWGGWNRGGYWGRPGGSVGFGIGFGI